MVMINCDMGEAFGLYKMGDDEGLMPLIDVANVACGFHASDFNHMRATVRLAKRHGVKVGAHPSLPDLQGFGRREMKIGREELANCLIYQIGALKAFLDAEGMALNHIKPHGALYGMAARMEEIGAGRLRRGRCLQGAAARHERHAAREGLSARAVMASSPSIYADLDYADDGGLIITREHEAKDPNRCGRAVRCGPSRKARRERVGGKDMPVGADSICVHSDTPNAVAIAEAVREAVRPYLARALKRRADSDQTTRNSWPSSRSSRPSPAPSTAGRRRTSRPTRPRATRSRKATRSA